MCELIDDLGKVPVYTVDKIGDKTYKEPVPFAIHYECCGPQLKKLSRYEYAALVKLAPKRENVHQTSTSGRHAVKHFPLDPQHPCHIMKDQMLMAKQATVVFCNRPPQHPRPCPEEEDTVQFQRWQDKANAFAKLCCSCSDLRTDQILNITGKH